MRSHLPIILLLAVLPMAISCERSVTEPGYEIPIMSDMKRPVPYEAYSEHQVLPGGVTMQAPVKGTVARGAMITLPRSNPLPFSNVAMARGKHLYQTYCLVCHGATGEGDGPMIPKYPNPPEFTSKKLMAMKAPDIFQAITLGKKDMPSHAGQIEENDRWALIYYVEKLQGKERKEPR